MDSMFCIGKLEWKLREIEKKQPQKPEIERLNKAVDNYEDCLVSVEKIRANAIKKFARKLKAKSVVWRIDNFDMGYQITDEEFDNLVKEMVGEEDG
jgi:hypothetical protein